ncbi:MAG: FHA domain-containing protein [Planctomycetota bacterium]
MLTIVVFEQGGEPDLQSRSIEMHESDIVIGRDSKCQLQISDGSISRQHAKLFFENGNYYIEDLKSSNGTFLNGDQVFRAVQLGDGDSIRLGNVRIEIRSRDLSASCSSQNPTISFEHLRNSDSNSASTDSSHSPKTADPAVVTQRGQFDDDSRTLDNVNCTVFAPPNCPVNDTVLIQVFAHIPEQAVDAEEQALVYDEDAVPRGMTTLGTKIERGSVLTFELVSKQGGIDEAFQSLTWNGDPVSVTFEMEAPTTERTMIGKVIVSQDSIPIGTIRFKVKVCDQASPAEPACIGTAKRFSKVFISYSSKDLSEVLKRVQMLKQVGIEDIFQDLQSIKTGQPWQPAIIEAIDRSDVMFLFWSTAAKESSEVAKEWQYGLETKGDGYIHPVVIEGPPVIPPPSQLAHLHFNDKINYFISSC